ncbi:7493_t:CDS:2 [Entrophospora sp. SA101]|nr:7493_t:CDS:2 [Entrophospora sp. SA101]
MIVCAFQQDSIANFIKKLQQVLSKISTLVADIIVRSWNELIMKLLDITCNNYSTGNCGITDLYRVD